MAQDPYNEDGTPKASDLEITRRVNAIIMDVGGGRVNKAAVAYEIAAMAMVAYAGLSTFKSAAEAAYRMADELTEIASRVSR